MVGDATLSDMVVAIILMGCRHLRACEFTEERGCRSWSICCICLVQSCRKRSPPRASCRGWGNLPSHLACVCRRYQRAATISHGSTLDLHISVLPCCGSA